MTRYDGPMKRPLNPTQSLVLQFIQEHPGCTASSGAIKLTMEIVTFRRIAEGFDARNLLRREPPQLRSASGRWWAKADSPTA